MPPYLFEEIAATPYAKTLAMQAGRPLSAFPPPARGYLTGADIVRPPTAPVALDPPEPLADLPSAIIGHTTEPAGISDLVRPAPATATPTNQTFEPVVQGVTQETPNVADATIETKIPTEPIPEPATEPTAHYDYDVAVIGGGPAGYTAAIRAAELGAKVILFEMDEIGGTDLYRGRIQTKAYCKMGERTREIQKAVDCGISVPNERMDLKRCVASTEALVVAMAADIRNRLAACAVTVVNTRAALKSEHEIFSGAGAFTADKVILCGGRAPLVPALPGMDHAGILTSDEIFRLKTLPKRLLVLGGGSIGCQIAAVFSAFGCKVILVEKQPRILPDTNPQISCKVAASLAASGVKLVTGVTVFGVSDAGGLPCAETEMGGIECDLLFLATGRKPNLLGLGLLADRIAQENGAVKVNAAMQTSVPNIYAAGDIVNGAQRITGVLEKARVAAECAFLI